MDATRTRRAQDQSEETSVSNGRRPEDDLALAAPTDTTAGALRRSFRFLELRHYRNVKAMACAQQEGVDSLQAGRARK